MNRQVRFKSKAQRYGQFVTFVTKTATPGVLDNGWPDPDEPEFTEARKGYRVFIQPPRAVIIADVTQIGDVQVDDYTVFAPYDVPFGPDLLYLEWDGSRWNVQPRDAFYINGELVYKQCVVKRQTPGNSGA